MSFVCSDEIRFPAKIFFQQLSNIARNEQPAAAVFFRKARYEEKNGTFRFHNNYHTPPQSKLLIQECHDLINNRDNMLHAFLGREGVIKDVYAEENIFPITAYALAAFSSFIILFLFHAVNFSTVTSNIVLYCIVGYLLAKESKLPGTGFSDASAIHTT